MYLSKKKLAVACFLAVTNMVCIGGAQASETNGQNDELQSYSLDEFVVTASRVETAKVDTPANVSVITKEEIEDQHYANASDILRDVPGVNVLGSGAKGTNMGQDTILVNGDSRVLVLIDGRRVNLGSSGNTSANWLPPVNAIEKVEVLKGGGSALYGTDAVGGVINIITKKGSNIGNHVNVKAAGGSFNAEQYSITASGSTDNGLSVLIAANKDRRGDYKYKDKNGDVQTLDNSGYNDIGTIIKFDQQIGKDNRLTLNLEHNNVEGGAPFGYLGFGNTDSYKRINNNIALRYDWLENSNSNGYVQVYRNYQHAQFLSPDISNQSDFTDSTNGIEAQQNFRFNDKDELTAGLEYYKTEVENTVMYAGKRSIDNKAIFVENRWKFADSWQLNTGLRYDHHNMYGNEFTPKIALNKKFNDDSNMYLSWGKVFNAPTTDDLYWYQPVYGMFGNPDLKPEKGDVWTLGGNTKLSDKTNLSASVFYSDIKDAIDWDYNSAIYESHAINVNKEKRRGAEVSLNHVFTDELSGYASYTYVQAKQDKGTGFENDRKIKPNIYKAGLKYKNDKWLMTLNTTMVSGQDESQYTDKHYFTLDLGAEYKVNKNAKIFVNGYNLTNARFSEYGGLYGNGDSKYPMPARSFIVGAEYTF